MQVAVTLKHMVANSLESTVGWSPEETDEFVTRHNISVNVSNFSLSDAYFPGFRAAIKHAGAKGIMCSCACEVYTILERIGSYRFCVVSVVHPFVSRSIPINMILVVRMQIMR